VVRDPPVLLFPVKLPLVMFPLLERVLVLLEQRRGWKTDLQAKLHNDELQEAGQRLAKVLKATVAFAS